MISKTNQYAIRAVLYLAQESGSPVPAAEIARGLQLPANYLSKILHALARAGVLESGRGPKGGFRLARAAKTVSLAEVMAPFDPFVSERTCLLGQSQCSDATPCRLHDGWKRASDPVMEFFSETTIADLVGKVDLCL